MPHPRPPRKDCAAIESLESRRLLAANVVDVMVLYDASAKTGLNTDDAGIQKLIRQTVETANQVHYNTNDNVVLRLVYTGLVGNVGTTDINVALGRLRTKNDGFIDEAHTLRDAYGADLVSLVSNVTLNGGLANLLTTAVGDATNAFSVIRYSTLGPGNTVLAHEMGHNLGGGHEITNSDNTRGPFPYSRGYISGAASNGQQYGDTMSYAGLTDNGTQVPGVALPYFATPTVTYRGVALGNASTADLLTTFNATAPVVAAYRGTLVADTVAPTATLYQTDLQGTQLTFTVRYADDVAVDSSTIDAADVKVTTPEGFVLTPALLSLDRAGDGYAKLATYRVVLPDSRPAVSSLAFTLGASQVKDTNGNFAAAGALAVNPSYDNDFSLYYARARDTGAMGDGQSRTLTGTVDAVDSQDLYKFTTTQPMVWSAVLSGLSNDVEVQIYKDNNDNDLPDQGEIVAGSNTTGSGDRAVTKLLPAGTYYILVQQNAGSSSYTLNWRTYTDVTPPTVTIDTADVTSTPQGYTFTVRYTDNEELDLNSIKFGSQISFSHPGGYNGSSGSTDSITVVSPREIYATYVIPIGQNLANGTVTLSMYNAAVKDAAGNVLPAGTAVGSYRIAAAQSDNIAPTASVSSAPAVLVPGGTTYDFVVAYRDNRAGVGAGPIGAVDNSDIVVTGPGGFSQPAQFVTSIVSPGTTTRFATYRINAPAGGWKWQNDGTYTLNLQSNQVRDAASQAVPAGALGTFAVHVPYPGDATGDDTTDFNDLVKLAQNYNTSGHGLAEGDFNYDGVVDFNDLVLMAQNYNTSKPAAPVAGPVLAGAGAPLSSDESTAAAKSDPAAVTALIASIDPAGAQRYAAMTATPTAPPAPPVTKKKEAPKKVFSDAPVKAPVIQHPVVRKVAAKR